MLFPPFCQLVANFSASGGGTPTVHTDSYFTAEKPVVFGLVGKVEDGLLAKLNGCGVLSPVVTKRVRFPYYGDPNPTPQPCFDPRILFRSGVDHSASQGAIPNVDLGFDSVRCIYGRSWIPCTVEGFFGTLVPSTGTMWRRAYIPTWRKRSRKGSFMVHVWNARVCLHSSSKRRTFSIAATRPSAPVTANPGTRSTTLSQFVFGSGLQL